MKEKQDKPILQIAGSIAFFLIISAINRSHQAGIAFMAAMFFHECGHLFFFWLYGIKANIRNIFPLGMVASAINRAENARSDLLHWWKVANILQAGPIINTVQLAIGVCMVKFNVLPEFAHQVVYINGLLGLFNLLPFGNMDGGQLFLLIFSSLKKKYDVLLSVIVCVVIIVATVVIVTPYWSRGGWAVAYSLWQQVGWWPFVLLFAIGLATKQGMDNDADWESPQAMTSYQVAGQLAIYAANVSVSLYLFSL